MKTSCTTNTITIQNFLTWMGLNGNRCHVTKCNSWFAWYGGVENHRFLYDLGGNMISRFAYHLDLSRLAVLLALLGNRRVRPRLTSRVTDKIGLLIIFQVLKDNIMWQNKQG